MIPKVIHYCWFGGNPLPESAIKCIESWKKHCPDYEIKQWNETNYDYTKNKYMLQAYEQKRWGFVPDYARFDIVYMHGGIYLDTDVEVIKHFNDLLELDGFCGVEQESEYVGFGLGFGAKKRNQTIKAIRDYYNGLSFIKNGEIDLTPSPKINTYPLYELGFKISNEILKCGEITVFPSKYFCPQNFNTGEIVLTDNTYSIHHYDCSWYSEKEIYSTKLKKKLAKFMPRKMAGRIAYFIAQCKYDGFRKAVNRTFKEMKRDK